MTNLTEASLTKALEELLKLIEQRNEPITLKPTIKHLCKCCTVSGGRHDY